MFQNRITGFYESAHATETETLVPASFPAFVACPTQLFAMVGGTQQAVIAEVYRQAYELAQAQLKAPVRRRLPEFSVN